MKYSWEVMRPYAATEIHSEMRVFIDQRIEYFVDIFFP